MKEKEKGHGKEVQIVIFRLRNEEFGVDISRVREIVRMMEITHIPEAPGFIEGVINLRGDVIAVLDLAKQFDLGALPELPKSARIVVVEVEGKTLGMIVDEVPEVLRIAEDDIQATPEVIQTRVHTDYIRGVGKLADRLIILLNIEKVLSPHELEQAASLAEGGVHG